MANIKVSELSETTTFNDDDYTMIVQNNQNKKISKENMLNDINTAIGNLSNLETSDKSNVVSAINELKNGGIYSTEEIKTNNVWIDDNNIEHPIYRKRFAIEVDSESNLYINHNLQNIDKMWLNQEASFYWGQNESIPLNYYYSSTDWGRSWLTTTHIRIRVASSNFNVRTAYIVIEYTKTTD